MATLTAQVSPEFLQEIDALARKLDRPRAWLIKHAVARFLEEQAVAEKRWSETLEAIDAAERGDLDSSEEIFDWLDTWGQRDEVVEGDQ